MDTRLSIWNRLVLIALRCAGIRIDAGVVQRGQHEAEYVGTRIPEGVAFSDRAAELSRELYRQEAERTRSFEDKGRTLLTVNGLLISVLVAVGRFGPVPILGLIFSVTPLLLSLIVLLELHGPRVAASPAIDGELLGQENGEQRTRIALDYVTARLFLKRSNDYLLDLLEAARKLVAFGLVAAVAVGFIALLCGAPTAPKAASVSDARQGDSGS